MARVKKAFVVLLLTCPLPVVLSAQSYPITFQKSPVLIVLDRTNSNPTICSVHLQYGKEKYEFNIGTLSSDDAENLQQFKKRAGWKKGYLFIPVSCGGGNAWRCDLDRVFKIKGKKLIKVGSVLGEYDSPAPGSWYRGGIFLDVYDRFEDKAMVCHALSPSFMIVMKDIDDHFEVDLNETWRQNRNSFVENSNKIAARLLQNKKVERTVEDDIVSAVLTNGILAKYCKKNREFDQVALKARTLLSDQDFSEVEKIFAEVKPSEIMSSGYVKE